MNNLDNCPKCGALFVRTAVDTLCKACKKKENEQFEQVYNFIRQRENRQATIIEISEATDVDEETIMRFVKEGRLRPTQFPNLGYKCERCGNLIQTGKLCKDCVAELKKNLSQLEQDENRKQAERKASHAYYSIDKDRK